MSYLRYEQEMDQRALERTPYRYVSRDCLYCGYNTRPSLSRSCCTGCNVMNKNKKDKVK